MVEGVKKSKEEVEYLRVYMRQLRSELEIDPEEPRYISNEPGVGDRFILNDC